MLQQILSAIPVELLGNWLVMAAFGAYHGLNPGMGWLFALALGLQQQSERAIWRSLLPITLGHALSLVVVAGLVLAGSHFISPLALSGLTSLTLLGFGAYKLLNYYRHPRWVGMKVGFRDLFAWSFLMAAAHGAGLMVAPSLVNIANAHTHDHHAAEAHQAHLAIGTGLSLGVVIHTGAMLVVMAFIAWVVYKKVGLAVLRTSWLNFDLIWAIALLVVGGFSFWQALA
jgi:hypothetical protein